MNNKQRRIFFFFLPLALGIIVSLITIPFFNFKDLNKPVFTPPQFVFPIVWTIFYLILGFAYVRLFEDQTGKRSEKVLYFLGLFANLAWPILFFIFRLLKFSSIWLVALIFLVGYFIKKTYQRDKLVTILLILYFLWLLFAFVLNISVAALN